MKAALAFHVRIFERTTLLTNCHVFVFHSLHTSPQSVHMHDSVASVCIAHPQHVITVAISWFYKPPVVDNDHSISTAAFTRPFPPFWVGGSGQRDW